MIFLVIGAGRYCGASTGPRSIPPPVAAKGNPYYGFSPRKVSLLDENPEPQIART
jgi:hypothetical protein